MEVISFWNNQALGNKVKEKTQVDEKDLCEVIRKTVTRQLYVSITVIVRLCRPMQLVEMTLYCLYTKLTI